jgi:hypothetical protein
MKTKIFFYITILLCLNTVFSFAQHTYVGESWTVQGSVYGDQTYIARDAITLKPNFHYKADENNSPSFIAKIDAALLFPPTSNTYALPDGTITTDPSSGGVVGAIPGSFSVSPSGAAIYTVPIEVPKGINGMEPKVSLVYSSQAGNGIA